MIRGDDNANFAAALSYPPDAEAPILTAAGQGKTAELIVSIAKRNNIAVISDKSLARALSSAEIGRCVPVSTYRAVAAVFAFIQKLKTI